MHLAIDSEAAVLPDLLSNRIRSARVGWRGSVRRVGGAALIVTTAGAVALGVMSTRGVSEAREQRLAPDAEAVLDLAETSQKVRELLDGLKKPTYFSQEQSSSLKSIIDDLDKRAEARPWHTPGTAVPPVRNLNLPLPAPKPRPLVGTVAVEVAEASQESVKLRQASCALNVVQASEFLARAGMQIDQAVKTCQAPALVGWSDPYKHEACAANAAGVFSSIAWVATYLSLAASQCGAEPDVPAVCAGTITGIVATLGSLAVQANFVAAHCSADAGDAVAANTETDAIWQMTGRRLGHRTLNIDGRFPADRDAELAACVLDVSEATTALAQMGLNIRAAERSCKVWEKTGQVPLVNKNMQDICTVDVGQVLYGVGQAATYIASATSHCMKGINVPALCASGVAGLVTSMAGLVYMSSGVDLSCVQLPKLGKLQDPAVKYLGQGIARRLLEGNATESSA